jgi:hypothetical protein
MCWPTTCRLASGRDSRTVRIAIINMGSWAGFPSVVGFKAQRAQSVARFIADGH